MLKFLVIDDTYCKKELQTFIKNKNVSVKAFFSTKELARQAVQIADGLKSQVSANKLLAVNSSNSTVVFNTSEIIRCQSDRNYTKLYLTNKREVVASKTLIEFEKQLDKYYNFVRIHKSHLINICFMEKFEKTEGGHVILSDGTKLPVATRKKELLFKQFDKL